MYLLLVLSRLFIGMFALLVWEIFAFLFKKGDWTTPAKWLLITCLSFFGLGLLVTGVLA